LSGAGASKYTPPVNDTITTGVITPKQLTIEVPDVSTTKAYDGTTNVNAAAKALKGVIGSDVVSASIAATYDNKNAGTNKTIAVVYTLDGANAANYIKPVDTVITVGEITQALLTVKVKADAKFAGENDVPAYKGVVITGYVNGENATAINQSGLNITRSNSGNNTSGDYTGVLVATGLAADNYSFSYTDGDYSIVPADQLLVRLKDTTVSYGSSPVYVLESAKYFKTGASLVDLTSTTTVAGDTIVAHDGAVATQFNIALVNNSGIRPTVGTYRLDTANVSLSVNVTSVKLLGNYTVTAKGLTVNSSGGASKVYDGSMSMNGVQLQLNGLIAGDKVQVSGNGAFDSKQAGGNKPYTVSSLQLLGMDADNYYLSGSNSISGNDGTILKKQLSISAPTVTASKLVDGTDTASVIAGSLMGVEAGEVVNVITTAKYSDAVIGNNKVIKVSYQLSGADTINYIKPVDDSVTNGIILDKLLTISAPTVTMSKQYDGNTSADVTIGTISGVIPGDDVTVSGVANYDTKNVGTNKSIVVVYTLSGANAGKYVAPKNDTITTGAITAKQLSVTAPTLTLSKVYDGTTAATVSVGTLSGIIDGESVLIDAIAVYDDKNVGTGKTIYVNYTLDGATINNYVRPTNYSTTTGAITAAPLTVKVNDDAKFVGETDATTYKGVSISGYVNGETITEIDTTLLVVSRNNVGVENAGDYDTVLSATGLAANNYSFNYVQGKYSIIPADHLLVNLATAKTIYGDSVTYVVESAKYFKSAGNVLVDLTSTTSIKGDGVEVKDGATKTTFAITIPSGSYSSANQLKVGSYVLDTAAVVLSANVVSAKVIGVREVSAKTLTVKTTDGVSKAYDGTKSMASLQLGFDSLLTNDKVTVSGLGYFDTRHTGINKTYELSNMQLGGADALNYCLLGGNNSISGNNGIISVKQLIIANPFIQTSKIYDTNTTATILAIGSLLNAADGDDIAVSAMANYSNAAVGKNKTITVKYTITGADTGNYIKPVDNIDTTGEIISAASFTVSADSLNSFVACTNDTTVAQRFTITGVGLTASLTVSAPIGFELKDSLGNSYDSTLAIVPDTAGNIITTVYVRMKAQAISPANGNIIISTTGLADDSIAVRGVVNALPTVVAISGTATACVGSTTALTNVTTGGIWSSNTTGIATVNASGVVTSVNVGNATITYTVTNANGCVSAVTKTITINALPIVTASINNGKAEKGSNVVLSATGVGSFAWTPATNLLNPDKATTVARVLDNTTYTVTLTNASGCSSTASVLVEATDNMNFEAAYVFTPNGDGINDKFVIKNIEAYPDNKLMVYDRLGKPIYEASGYANNWDGKVNGFTLAKDTYFYVLSVKGQVVKRGAITLVR
jgi:gliding motility-associated-like protein